MRATTTNGSTTKLRYQQCIGLAIEEEMLRDERVFAMGQDITTLGGQFGLSKALMGKFGSNRVRDTAINEAFMIGGACGAAIEADAQAELDAAAEAALEGPLPGREVIFEDLYA